VVHTKLLNEQGESLRCMEISDKAVSALSKERLQILKLLIRRPMYAAEIGRAMDMEAQALYYHLKLLQQTHLIKFAEYEERHGGIAKKYVATAESFAFVLETEWKPFTYAQRPPKIFQPFIEHETFRGKFILGSPDPHGKYRARGSEFPFLELAMMLGNYASFSFPLYLLDTQTKENDKKQNLIVAGGPKVNILAAELNSHLPIRFEQAMQDVYSRFSKKRYTGNVGVIELIPNPFSRRSKILLLGGLNHHGTRAAILAILKKTKTIDQGNRYHPSALSKVVEGFDEDGDGMVDAVEILE